jgi:hypothetical protein
MQYKCFGFFVLNPITATLLPFHTVPAIIEAFIIITVGIFFSVLIKLPDILPAIISPLIYNLILSRLLNSMELSSVRDDEDRYDSKKRWFT